MSDYIVSARKYRPTNFNSVVGQSALTTTLKNAIATGKLAHAYLFCGPRGVGKTTSARIFAKTINCLTPSEGGEACDHCESCVAFNEGRSYNIHELDAASNNSVDDIRELIEQVQIPPQVGRYKVFIIDEVHMLSQAAFNAFLKTLEEPPAHAIFILATTEKHKILPTILSRCQIYDFERMTVPNIIDHLKRVAEKENIQYDEEALNVIAEKADGGMRDALSIFDQVASFSQGNITYQKVIEDLNVLDAENYFNIIDLALENKVSEIMVLLNSVINKGFDGGHLVNGLASHVRNVLMAKDAQTLPLLEVSEQLRNRYQLQAQKCPVNFLYTALQIMNRCDVEYRQSSNKRLLVELTLIQVAQITQKDDDVPASGRSPKRLKSLFKNLVLKAQQKPTPQVVGSLKRDDDAARGSNDSEVVSVEVVSSPEKPITETSGVRPKVNVSSGLPNSVNLGSLTMSFDNLLKTDKKKKQDEEVEITNKDEHEGFTQQDLVVSWRAMCSRMPERMQALSQRMKNITPTISEYPAILVLADNNIQLNEMLAIKSRIRATLAKELRNGQIEVEIRLAKHEEIKPMLTPRESLSKLLETNHPVKKLIDTLGLCLD